MRLGSTVRGGVANIETGFRPARFAPIVGRDEIPPDWLALPVVPRAPPTCLMPRLMLMILAGFAFAGTPSMMNSGCVCPLSVRRPRIVVSPFAKSATTASVK